MEGPEYRSFVARVWTGVGTPLAGKRCLQESGYGEPCSFGAYPKCGIVVSGIDVGQ